MKVRILEIPTRQNAKVENEAPTDMNKGKTLSSFSAGFSEESSFNKMGTTCERCSDTAPTSTAKVRDTQAKRPTTKRRKKLKRPPKTNTQSSGYDTDDDDGEISPHVVRAISQFKEFIKSGAEDKAIALVDQHHDIDFLSVKFPKGFDCLQMAVRNEMPKLVLFLLEEGHSVKFI